MARRLLLTLTVLACAILAPATAAAEDRFDYRSWQEIEGYAGQGDQKAQGLRDGYLAGVRDALRFYTRVSRTFPICWPRDHEIDIGLVQNVMAAVQREHPEIAKPDDNYGYLLVLALYEAYPCR
jgi:hypothetical protein